MKIKKVNNKKEKIAEFENELLKRGEIFQKSDIHNIALGFSQQEFAGTLKKVVLLALNRRDPPPMRDIREYIASTASILDVLHEKRSIFNDIKSFDIEKTKKYFEEDLHLDWFEEVWEMPVPGSGPDLSALAAYGFLGYIYDTNHPSFLPWTFHELFAWHRAKREKIPPRDYIKKLIQNCENFLSSSNSLSSLFPLFDQALSFAKARSQLDFMEEIDANNFAIFCGRDVRTLANNGLLMPKESHKSLTVLKKHAVDFLENKKRPDGSLIKKDKAKGKIGAGIIDPFPESFYLSIWKEQIFYKASIDNITLDDHVELCRLEDFASDPVKGVEKYVRIVDEFPSNVAPHNKARVKWIGEGKTFNEINAPNSKYRQNCKWRNYAGNTSSINRGLSYDLKKKWIKKIIE